MHSLSRRQAVTPLVLTLAIASGLWYMWMLVVPSHVEHPVAYSLMLAAEIIGMVQLLGLWLTIILGSPERVPYEVLAVQNALKKNPKLAGNVVVFVTVAGEPMDLVRPTIEAARDIRFPHKTYLLDDGKSDEMRNLAGNLGVGYVRRADRAGWKAGNINHALRHIACDYFAIFDCDHVAKPEFLIETLPFLVTDKQLAFVQTPQAFGNTESFIGGGIAESQEIFYRHIQTAKNRFNSAFCVGTNVVFRAKAVREIGGMYAKSNSEDIWTSLLLHEKGWKSHYLPMVLAIGRAPDTVEGYFRQQFRWARGGYELLLHRNPLLSRTLTFDQKLQYFHTAAFFLNGLAVFAFFILPLLYVYFGWKPIAVDGGAAEWAAHFVPYFLCMYGATIHLLGRVPRWRTLVVALCAFWAHITAGIAVLTGVRIRWSASGVVRSNIDYVKAIAPHLLILLLSLGAIPILTLTEEDPTLTVMLSCWLLWNSSILFAVCRRAIPRFDTLRAPVPTYGYTTTTA